MHITEDLVFSLSPDAGTYERGQSLGVPQRWAEISRNDRAIWAGVRVGNEVVFRTAVDLAQPPIAFRCDCPVRKKPCKHGIGLLLLFLRQPEVFGVAEPAKDVADWLDKRSATKTPKVLPERTSEQTAQLAVGRENRHADRLEAMNLGLRDIRLWMQDLARLGIANAMQQGSDFWGNIAARCTDAKLGGFGRLFRAIAFRHGQNPDDVGTIADRIAEIWLAVRAFDRFDLLEPAQQDDLLSLAGVNTPKSALETKPKWSDVWTVVGIRHGKIEDDINPLPWRRTHLFGLQSQCFAMFVDYATPPTYTFEQVWQIGSSFEGDIVFYPSAYPLRAIMPSGQPAQTPPFETLTGLEEMLRRRAEALAKNPWLRVFPCIIEGRVSVRDEQAFFFTDALQQQLPLQCSTKIGWQLVALTGGESYTIMSEFEGSSLTPLGICINETWLAVAEV